MNAIEYLKNKLNELVIDFPNIKCTYGFEGFDNSHVIEISPSEFFNSNKNLYEALVKIDLNFIG